MIDWSKSMVQTFEFYEVDPSTWADIRLLTKIKSATIDYDLDAETLGSAKIDSTESLGECYIRMYLIASQNGEMEKRPLGTFLVQTPSFSFDGKIKNISMDAYTPLIELKEKMPDIGYFIPANTDPVSTAYKILSVENSLIRAPVINPGNPDNVFKNLYDNFVSDPNETWCSFIINLLAKAEQKIGLDEMGRVVFIPNRKLDDMQPIWTYTDDNSSILYPDVSSERDLYGIPNVVEVVYSDNSEYFDCKVYNHDPASPVSVQARGREIVYRDTKPNISGYPSLERVKEYAKNLLIELSSVEFSLSYTHGYCPVKIGDCVRLNYTRAGLNNIKAIVKTQSISCTPGTPVTEKVVFSNKLLNKKYIEFASEIGSNGGGQNVND